MKKWYYHGAQKTYDSITVVTGFSVGLTAKKLCEKVFKTLVFEHSSTVTHIRFDKSVNDMANKFIHISFMAVLLSFLMASFQLQAQETAQWIGYPSANVTDYGVFHFRRDFKIEKVPEKLNIEISADNRYHLFVNGKRISYGPAKGDLSTYKYDIINIAPYLRPGKNLLAALVFNAGKDKPMAFLSAQTAFYFNVEDSAYEHLRSDENWKTYENVAYSPISYQEMIHSDKWFNGYYACGPGDDVDTAKYPWGWEQPQYDDSDWKNPEILAFEGEAPWNLVPRNIPFMDDYREKPKSIRKVEGISEPKEFLEGQRPIRIPANSEVKILFDYGILTMGYPELTVNKGMESSVKIKYAEALYEKVNLKAHRDSVEGKTMFGVWDIFRPDGAASRTFKPLWKRTFRYVELVIETKEEPLEILSFENEYSGYPYPEMATFESDDESLNQIFEISNRTLRMCSGETYYDTPFYEQLSYGGDNRPITAISTYNSNDDRLLREMLRLYPQSRNTETKLFKSAYPSRFDFDMGSWSLAWIQTLQDYYFMRGDADFVRQFDADIDGVLGFFRRHMDEEKGILATVVNHNFMDWSISKGSIPRANEGREMTHSAMLTLYYAHTLDCTARLYNEIGLSKKAEAYRKESEKIKISIKNLFWNEGKKMFSDNLDQNVFSQHTNLLAILCDVIPLAEQQLLLKRILAAEDLTEYASSYFSFFMFKAMEKTGQEHLFLDNLDFWHGFLAQGHTTCGETGFASHDRSDSHAWSAHPSYYLLRLVCGIKPANIGFREIKITPHLGDLTNIKASMPHLKGRIKVAYKVKGKNILAEIELPPGLSGTFEYNGQTVTLASGANTLKVKN